MPANYQVLNWKGWKYVIEQMARMRMNLLMIHNHNGDGGVNEMFLDFPIKGVLPRVSFCTVSCGYMICGCGWNVGEYYFRVSGLFDDYDFGSEAMLQRENLCREDIFAKGAGHKIGRQDITALL